MPSQPSHAERQVKVHWRPRRVRILHSGKSFLGVVGRDIFEAYNQVRSVTGLVALLCRTRPVTVPPSDRTSTRAGSRNCLRHGSYPSRCRPQGRTFSAVSQLKCGCSGLTWSPMTTSINASSSRARRSGPESIGRRPEAATTALSRALASSESPAMKTSSGTEPTAPFSRGRRSRC